MAEPAPERTPPDDTTEGERLPASMLQPCEFDDSPGQEAELRRAAPVTAEDLRERMAKALAPWCRVHEIIEAPCERCALRVDAVVAALAGDPGDLRERMAAALRAAYNAYGTADRLPQMVSYGTLADAAMSVLPAHHAAALARIRELEAEVERRRLAYNGANAMKGVHKRRADNLRRELDHAKAALAGDNEGVRLFMADCEQRVARLKEQAELSARGEQQAEAEVERLTADIERVQAVHVINDIGECIGCRTSWPCPTIEAITEETNDG